MDPFETLGLPPRYELDRSALDARYRDLQRALHPDRHGASTPTTRRMSVQKAVEVNEAYRALKDDVRRAEALLAFHGVVADPARRESPELLMEVLELREALSEARAARDLPRARKLAEGVRQREQAAQRELAQLFDAPSLTSDAGAAQRALGLVGQLRYFRRFLDEAAMIEEEAEG